MGDIWIYSNLINIENSLKNVVFNIQKPKVGLLNIGSEEIKGTESIKKAYSKLKEIDDEND